jgi:predicted acyl esterase
VTFNTDPPNTAIVGTSGLNSLTTALPILSDMNLAESVALSYTTKPLSEDVLAAGPLALEVRLSTTAPETGIWVVLTDVSPDGTSHPLTVGRLLSSFPDIDRSKSLFDPAGNVVQPYGDFSRKTPKAGVLKPHLYQVELWPVGNRFKQGHRIRLDIVGASGASLPTAPGINSVRVGGTSGSRLLFPVLPGSDLARALG